MSKIDVRADLKYDVRFTTVFLFQIAAGRTEHQSVIWEQLEIDPPLFAESYSVGLEGNQLHRIVVQPGVLRISYQGNVQLAPEINRPISVGESNTSAIPPEVLTYLNPSRYCQSDLLARFAFEEFGQLPRGFSRVQAICDWVFEHLDYTPGSTNSSTTAADVLLQRTGVCRDYAHLAITLCRGVGIPARYVAGYAVGLQPPDFHGFMEAFLDGQWYLFDPTRLVPVSGLVRIGVGRDAADVSFATLTGDALLLEKTVWASYSDFSQPPQLSGGDQPAVSTA
jgi:transglutaminase-like putative cysteine protease